MPQYIAGLDLGSIADYTAMVVIERSGKPRDYRYGITHIERISLGTSYPDIIGRVCNVMASPKLREAPLIVDATGVGRPVLDMVRRTGLLVHGITITGGQEASKKGRDWTVPKRDLIMGLLVLLQDGRLIISDALPLAKELLKELLNIRVTQNVHANVMFESWREGIHDDIVFATAVGVWWGEHAMHEIRYRELVTGSSYPAPVQRTGDSSLWQRIKGAVKATGGVFSGTVPLPTPVQSRPFSSSGVPSVGNGGPLRSIGDSSYAHLPDYRDGWYNCIQDTSQSSLNRPGFFTSCAGGRRCRRLRVPTTRQ